MNIIGGETIKQKDRRINELLLEVNGLKNAIRALSECRETHALRKRIGERRHENRVEREYTGDLAQAEREHEQLVREEIDYHGLKLV